MNLEILHIMNIVLTLMCLVGLILLMKVYSPWAIWAIPLVVLLIHKLIFSITFLVDIVDGSLNPFFYNGWSEILHIHSITTILAYLLGLIFQVRRKIRSLFTRK